jgi:hypothetical protein
MEIKRTVLPPFGGPREESGSNGSLWSMGGGIIGSPTPTPTPDLTLTNVSLAYSAPGWCFRVDDDTVPGLSAGDRLVASGFYVVNPDGSRSPSGSINVNGEWVMDQYGTQGIDGQIFTVFSSVALRSEIGSFSSSNASSFGSGTILLYNQ